MARIIQIEAMQTKIVDQPDGSKDIQGILWGLDDNGNLFKLGNDDKWEMVCKHEY